METICGIVNCKDLTHLHFDVYEWIGGGYISSVFAIHDKKGTGQWLAMKTTSYDAPQDEFTMALEEAKTLKKLDHPNIISPLASLTIRDKLCVFLPLMPFGSCQDILEKYYKGGFPEAPIAVILSQIIDALTYLHGARYVHCAIKSSHVLINGEGCAVLTGFRYMRQIPEDQDRLYSTGVLQTMKNFIPWLSPEILSQDKTGFDSRSDIYSLGMMTIELVTGVIPYKQMSPIAVFMDKKTSEDTTWWQKTRTEGVFEAGPSTSQAGPSTSQAGPSTSRGGAGNIEYSPEITSFINVCIGVERVESCSILMTHKFLKNVKPMNLLNMLKLDTPIHHDEKTRKEQLFQVEMSNQIQPAARQGGDKFEWNFDS